MRHHSGHFFALQAELEPPIGVSCGGCLDIALRVSETTAGASPECVIRHVGREVIPMSLEELAAQLRRGEIEDPALAQYAAEYAQAGQSFRSKKDD